MPRALLIGILALFISAQTQAQATSEPQPAPAAASSDSINELFELLNVRGMLEQIGAQTDSLIRSAINDSLNGRQLTPQQQSAVEEVEKSAAQAVRDELKWESLEPVMAEIYQRSLSEDEIQGMITFYRTPAGQAVIAKMPLIARNTMLAMQAMQKDLMAKLQRNLQEALAESKAKNSVSGS